MIRNNIWQYLFLLLIIFLEFKMFQQCLLIQLFLCLHVRVSPKIVLSKQDLFNTGNQSYHEFLNHMFLEDKLQNGISNKCFASLLHIIINRTVISCK